MGDNTTFEEKKKSHRERHSGIHTTTYIFKNS